MKKYLLLFCVVSIAANATDADMIENRPHTPTLESVSVNQYAPENGTNQSRVFKSIASVRSIATSLSGSFSGSLSSVSSLLSLGYESDQQKTPTDTQGATPITKQINSMNRLLGEEHRKELFPEMETEDIRTFLKENPDVYIAIMTAFGAYGDHEAQRVNQELANKGFVQEWFSENLAIYTNDQKKQAWFAISGTDSIGDMLTSIGILGNLSSADMHDSITGFVTRYCIPQWIIENWVTQYAVYALGYLSGYIEFNVHKMISVAYLIFGYSIIPGDFVTNTLNIQTLIAMSSMATGVMFYFNALPIMMKKWRYHAQIHHLLARIRTRRKELEDMGYEVLLSGHSLGGHMAEILGLLIGKRAFSFCAPGGAYDHAHSIYKNMPNELVMPTAENYKDKITKIGAVGDLISEMRHPSDVKNSVLISLPGSNQNLRILTALYCHRVAKH